MAEDAFETLLSGSYLQRFPTQLDLIREGEPADFLHVVIGGAVELFSAHNRRETTLAIMRPVSTFILAAALKDAPYLMSARTLEASEILLIPSENVRTGIKSDSALAEAMIIELAGAFRMVVKGQKNLKLRNGAERLAGPTWALPISRR